MEEISNKTLAILLIGAIVISLGGTLISLNRLARIRIPIITGLATDEATVALEIESLAAVNWTLNAIDWGTGTVVGGMASCRLDSYNSSLHANCTGFTPNSTGLILENIGNKNVTLNISCGKNAADFIGDGTQVNAAYQWNVSELEAGSAPGLELTPSEWQTAVTTHVVVANITGDGFLYEDNTDTLKFDVTVTMASDSPSGSKQDTITAHAVEI